MRFINTKMRTKVYMILSWQLKEMKLVSKLCKINLKDAKTKKCNKMIV